MDRVIKFPIWEYPALDEMYRKLGEAQFNWDNIPGAWLDRDVDVGMENVGLIYRPCDFRWEVVAKYVVFDFVPVDAPADKVKPVRVKVDLETIRGLGHAACEKAVVVDIGDTRQVVPYEYDDDLGAELAKRILKKFEEVNPRYGDLVRIRRAS